MEDDLYGLGSASAAAAVQSEYMSFEEFDYDRVQMAFGSIPIFPPAGSSSAVSEAASMAAAEAQRGGGGGGRCFADDVSGGVREKIASHPLYPKLLEAYIDCRKIFPAAKHTLVPVGAPPEIANELEEIRQESDQLTNRRRTAVSSSVFGSDPELDNFMETYCDILVKYKSDLSRPFDEATAFLNEMQSQLNSLCNNPTTTASTSYVSDEAGGSSEEELSGGEIEVADIMSRQFTNEDRELKDKLLRKYSGYISTLKHEFSKKKKKGKLPKGARQILLDWWTLHFKWPYPTEADKIALSELTGLDQKQINNWFINQRKRHWKPPENMQAVLMEAHSLYGPFCHE